jgi:16S rRNA (adenine1518-N6/adenine1519-N6)-dimethyltransferase
MQPRKRFGQHFLCDQGIIQQIVQALDPKPNEHLIEIGPGQGAITVPILKKVKCLEVIELDRDVITVLQQRIHHADQLKIYNEDVLQFDFAQLKIDDRLLRIFGNLPYNISTPVMFHLLKYTADIVDMLFMLQKEVAERLCAKPSTEHYGRLSVMMQYHCQVQLLFNVPAKAFFPPPQVQSSMVRLVPYKIYPHQAHHYPVFHEIVKQAFSQRRKTLRNSLKKMVSDEVWEQVNIRSDLRAENLSVQDYVEISNAV